jgi:hypothetical protein
MNWLSKYNKHILPVYIFEVCLVASNNQFIGIIIITWLTYLDSKISCTVESGVKHHNSKPPVHLE